MRSLERKTGMAELSKIGERDKLRSKARDEPHWQRLRAGCYLGYRPSRRGGKGTWFARAYDTDTGKYQRMALGDYGSLTGPEVFLPSPERARKCGLSKSKAVACSR
jgi:hypothetical protein